MYKRQLPNNPDIDNCEFDGVLGTTASIVGSTQANEALKMIEKGFQLVTVGSEQRFMTAGAKNAVEKLKGKSKSVESKTY